MSTNLPPESRRNVERALTVLHDMLRDARTDYQNRPNGTHEQRVRDLSEVVRRVEMLLHPSRGGDR